MTKLALKVDMALARMYEINGQSEVTLKEEILSPYERIKREEGETSNKTKFGSPPEFASNNERNKHNIEQNEITEYLKTLEAKLQPYEEIHLFGQGIAKDKLKNHLSENKHFNSKFIHVHNADQLTANQELAMAKKLLS
jgi:hypothetical protein